VSQDEHRQVFSSQAAVHFLTKFHNRTVMQLFPRSKAQGRFYYTWLCLEIQYATKLRDFDIGISRDKHIYTIMH